MHNNILYEFAIKYSMVVKQGDGGSPLIYNDKVVGVVNFGFYCGNSNLEIKLLFPLSL